MPAQEEALAQRFATVSWGCFFAAGVIGTLVAYGFLQERIMTQPFGDDRFTWSICLVFLNRVVAVAFSVTMASVYGEPLAPGAPLWKYLVVSISNVLASTCQYEALKYVSFAVQSLGKSFKMLPVMIWGIVISQKDYGARDWLVAIMVTGGVTEFLLTGPIKAHTGANTFHGLLLLAFFLGADGLTSTMQEKLFKENRVSKYNQMAYVNLLSCMVSLTMLLVSGDTLKAFRFAGEHPAFILDSLLLSLAAVGSQWFIYSQVKEFGALVFAATMNVRQMVSVVISYVHFRHPISFSQGVGLAMVFAALFYKSSLHLGFFGPEDPGEKQPLVTRDPLGPKDPQDPQEPKDPKDLPGQVESAHEAEVDTKV